MSWISSFLGLDSAHNAGVAAKQAEGQQQKASSVYDQLLAESNSPFSRLPDLQGYNANLPALLSQYAQSVGLPDPFAAPTSMQFQPGAGMSSATAVPQQFDPYALSANQSQILNQNIDTMAHQKQQAIAHVTAALTKAGYTMDSPVMQAQIRRISQQYDQQTNQARTGFQENARQQRETGLGNLTNMIGGLGNLQTSEAQRQFGNRMNIAQGYQGSAGQLNNVAAQNQQYAGGGLGSLLGLGLGLAGVGVPKAQGQPSFNPNTLGGWQNSGTYGPPAQLSPSFGSNMFGGLTKWSR